MRIFTLTSRLLAVLLLFASFASATKAAGSPTGSPVAYAITPNNTITAIDTGSHAVLGTIALSAPATFIVGTPDGKQLYATNNTNPTDTTGNSPAAVLVIDTQTSAVTKTLPLPIFPSGMVISKDGTRVYIVTQASSDYGGIVVVIDTTTNTIVANIATSEDWPVDIALSPDGKRVYVPDQGDNAGFGGFDVMDTTTNTLVKSLSEGSFQSQYSWVAVSPDSSKVYTFAEWMNDDGTTGAGVLEYSAATYAVIGSANVGYATLKLPLPNSSTLYGFASGGVLVYNTQTEAVVTTIPVANLNGLALTPDNTQLYASNAQSIAIIDTASSTVTGSVAVVGATGMTIVAAPATSILTPPILTLQLSRASVAPTSQSTLSWTSTGATSCTSSGAWTGSAALQGAQLVSFDTPGSYVFTLTCTGTGGTSTASATLTVIPGSTLTFSPSDIPVNTTAVLSWKGFAGATQCSGNGDWAGDLPASGSKVIGPYTDAGSRSFTLYCSGPPGGDTVTRSLSVYAPGPFNYTALAPNNDVNALAVPGTAATSGGLDNHGYAYDLQDANLPHPLTALGQTFSLGGASKPSGVSSQTIALGSAQLSNVTFLATAVNANQLNQSFVVTYSDGTMTTYKQSLSQWGSPQNYVGETSAAALQYRITPSGAKQSGSWNIYAYQIALDPTKVATSLKLPTNRDVIVLAINTTKAPAASPVSLSSAFNMTGLAAVGHAATGGGLDNHGYALEASLLPTGFTGAGQKFTMGVANQLDAVSNTTITLPAATRVGLTVLATAVNANQPNQTFLVTYKDGSTTTFTQGVSQWGSPQKYPGELDARSTANRITPAGAQQAGAWHVYAYTFETDSNEQIVSLTLPRNRDVVVFAVYSLTP